MNITLNGKPYRLEATLTVRQLTERLQLGDGQVAVERGRQIVPRSRWDAVTLCEGDEIEIVRFIGGG
jgi:thiamine biosynthesis protein ThiS